jgi:hypothetical protein
LTPDPLAPVDPVSPIAAEFGRRISPRLVSEIVQREDAIVAGSGGFLTRQAVRIGFPVALRQVPKLTEAGADAMLDEFGGLTITEVAGKLVQHNQAKHQSGRTHPSVAAAAAGRVE